MRIDLRKFGRIALFALPLTLIFAIACGGETVVTVVETVIVAPAVKCHTATAYAHLGALEASSIARSLRCSILVEFGRC